MPEIETNKELSRYRLEKAREDLATAKENMDSDKLRAANNRAYYSIFHSMRSVLALDMFDSKKHSGIIAEFRRRYVKEGVFEPEISDMIESASIVRNASDYDDMYVVSKVETEEQIKNAGIVLEKVESYLREKGVIA